MRTEEERGRETQTERQEGWRDGEREGVENIKAFVSISFLESEFYHQDEIHLV